MYRREYNLAALRLKRHLAPCLWSVARYTSPIPTSPSLTVIRKAQWSFRDSSAGSNSSPPVEDHSRGRLLPLRIDQKSISIRRNGILEKWRLGLSVPRDERARFNITVVLLFKLRLLSGAAARRMCHPPAAASPQARNQRRTFR